MNENKEKEISEQLILEENRIDTKVPKAEFLKLQKEIFESEDRYILTSDVDIIIDCIVSIAKIRTDIFHLSNIEQSNIMEKVKLFKIKMEEFRQLKYIYLDQSITEISRGILNERESRILEFFGKYYTVEDILRVIRLDWGVEEVDLFSLQSFYEQHIETIQEIRLNYRNSIDDLRLSHKVVRVEELSYLYRERKEIFEVTKSKLDEKALLEILKQIRVEAEGDTINIKGDININHEITITNQLNAQMVKKFNIPFLIISQLASRMGVDPIYIINSLSNSYYAKFTGFRRPEISLYEDEILYPTDVIYNFEEILKNKGEKDKILEEAKHLPNIIDSEQSKILSIKDQLLRKILKERRE